MDLRKYRRPAFLFLSLVIVFIFLWHGVPKAFNPTMASEKFVAMGFPGILGPIVGWLEVVAAIAILIGIAHNASYLLLAVIIAVALVIVHLPKGVTAGLERDLLILAATLLLAAEGDWYHPRGKKQH